MTKAPTIDSICMRGTYSPIGWAECIICPAGYGCPSIFGEDIVTCALGTYSLDLSAVSLQMSVDMVWSDPSFICGCLIPLCPNLKSKPSAVIVDSILTPYIGVLHNVFHVGIVCQGGNILDKLKV